MREYREYPLSTFQRVIAHLYLYTVLPRPALNLLRTRGIFVSETVIAFTSKCHLNYLLLSFMYTRIHIFCHSTVSLKLETIR